MQLDKIDESAWWQQRLPMPEFEGGGILMVEKTLKPPYYRLTATCSKHGTVQVNRKRNPKAGQPWPTGSGGTIGPFPESIVCPHCPWHCNVIGAEWVEK